MDMERIGGGMGFYGVLSIEHEDRLMGLRGGILKSVEFLQPILFS